MAIPSPCGPCKDKKFLDDSREPPRTIWGNEFPAQRSFPHTKRTRTRRDMYKNVNLPKRVQIQRFYTKKIIVNRKNSETRKGRARITYTTLTRTREVLFAIWRPEDGLRKTKMCPSTTPANAWLRKPKSARAVPKMQYCNFSCTAHKKKRKCRKRASHARSTFSSSPSARKHRNTENLDHRKIVDCNCQTTLLPTTLSEPTHDTAP